jgi:hypothetical protein
VSERLHELEKIFAEVSADPKNASRETRKRFWKLVRQIKRNPKPDDDEIAKASEIRNILFKADRGGTVPLIPALAIEFILGTFVALWGYLWLLGFPLDWSGIISWTLNDWGLFSLRMLCVMGVVALYYPFGRLIAGKWAGIRFDGMCKDQYYEPTLKIDYVSFLHAPATKRKWFFFFAGIWTVLTALAVGVVGLIVAQDFTSFIPAILILIFEGAAIRSGKPSANYGEMGHYNREKRIERVWKKNLAAID